MVSPWWHPSALAEVSRMRGRLSRDWNRNRNININRDLPADRARCPVRRFAVLCGREVRPARGCTAAGDAFRRRPRQHSDSVGRERHTVDCHDGTQVNR
jgi:hypothetical protein